MSLEEYLAKPEISLAACNQQNIQHFLINLNPSDVPRRLILFCLYISHDELTDFFRENQFSDFVNLLNNLSEQFSFKLDGINSTCELYILISTDSFEKNDRNGCEEHPPLKLSIKPTPEMVDILNGLTSFDVLYTNDSRIDLLRFGLCRSYDGPDFKSVYNPLLKSQSFLGRFEHVCIGGTFDKLHRGHRILLTIAALITRGTLYVGVTTKEMLNKKKGLERIMPFEYRCKLVKIFLELMNNNIKCLVLPLSDPIGRTLEEKMQALVVSKETEVGGAKINEMRRKMNLPELKIISIDLSYVPPSDPSIYDHMFNSCKKTEPFIKLQREKIKISSSLIREKVVRFESLQKMFLEHIESLGVEKKKFMAFYEFFDSKLSNSRLDFHSQSFYEMTIKKLEKQFNRKNNSIYFLLLNSLTACQTNSEYLEKFWTQNVNELLKITMNRLLCSLRILFEVNKRVIRSIINMKFFSAENLINSCLSLSKIKKYHQAELKFLVEAQMAYFISRKPDEAKFFLSKLRKKYSGINDYPCDKNVEQKSGKTFELECFYHLNVKVKEFLINSKEEFFHKLKL